MYLQRDSAPEAGHRSNATFLLHDSVRIDALPVATNGKVLCWIQPLIRPTEDKSVQVGQTTTNVGVVWVQVEVAEVSSHSSQRRMIHTYVEFLRSMRAFRENASLCEDCAAC